MSQLRLPDKTANAACAIFDPWTPASIENVRSDRMQRFIDAPRTPASDAQPITDPVTECKAPSIPAGALRLAFPEMPPIAAQQGITGSVTMWVGLNADGDVIATKVVVSPSQLLNASALAAARSSKFRPAIVQCQPVAATYVLKENFAAAP